MSSSEDGHPHPHLSKFRPCSLLPNPRWHMIPFKSVRQTLFVRNNFAFSGTLYQSSKSETRSIQQARSDCGANPDTLTNYYEPLDENFEQQIQLLREHFQQIDTDLNQLVGSQESLDRSNVHQRQKRHVIITPRLVPNHPQSRWTSDEPGSIQRSSTAG